MTFTDDARRWLHAATGIPPDELDPLRLEGSTSSTLFLLRSSADPDHPRSVLRLLDNRQWISEEPDLVRHEMAALQELSSAGLRGPRPIASVEESALFGAPAVLMSYVDGRVDLSPADPDLWLARMAKELASIHRHDGDRFAWHYRSWLDRSSLAPPEWSCSRKLWQQAIKFVLREEPVYAPAFIHRDYHPTNILWKDEVIAGVVDWINACRGPAGVDVAHCRTNLVQMYGVAVADRFLDLYCVASPGYRHDPYWDIASLLDMALPTLESYPPWREFGLEIVPAGLLVVRVEEHLAGIMQTGMGTHGP